MPKNEIATTRLCNLPSNFDPQAACLFHARNYVRGATALTVICWSDYAALIHETKKHRSSSPQITTSPDRQLYGNVNYSALSGQDGVIVAGLAQWHAPGGRL